MRRRLTVALVGLVAGALLVAGAGTLVVTRVSARHQAEHELRQQAAALASAAHEARSPFVLRAIRRVLRLEDTQIVVVTATGAVRTPLPAGLSAAELNPASLLAGSTVSGSSGGLAFVAAPIQLSPTEEQRLGPGVHPVVLLTRQIGALGPTWVYFLLVGGITLVVAAAVALQLSRRISGPLVDAVEVTNQIAEGRLEGRVPIRTQSSNSDIPELTSLATSINAMATSLEGARARERQLLLSVSHDLRTPLTSIRGFAEAIAEGAVEDPTRAAGVIIAESRRLERLVADLLDLAKLETQRLSLDLRPTDAEEVVADTLEAFQPSARGLDIALSAATPATAPAERPVLVSADRDRLAQVLANLIENALAYARSQVTVTVVGPPASAGAAAGTPEAPPGAPVELVVEDDGPGIAAGELERVFDRFYRADRGSAARGGSGLGLAIVAELTRAMGGHVHAESPLGPDGGTRMVVELRAETGPR